ncbi:adenylyltransferase/cytidyltransferase family protein [Candidatus Micrarchaeota archaeon]|nr:adenylyltransferase/cytidyltransferase family protein [Candidatus Micrarchaeota archaeon]
MDNIESIKKLLLLQLKENGISLESYNSLNEIEKKLLVKKSDNSSELFEVKPEERKKIKVVLTGGVFDIIHIGHLFTLTDAKKYGDILVVAIAKDEQVHKKGRQPIHSQEYRKIIVESFKPVDIALSGFDNPQQMVEFVRPDVIVYGYDQKPFLQPDGVEIVKLDRKIDDTKFKSGKILETLGL